MPSPIFHLSSVRRSWTCRLPRRMALIRGSFLVSLPAWSLWTRSMVARDRRDEGGQFPHDPIAQEDGAGIEGAGLVAADRAVGDPGGDGVGFEEAEGGRQAAGGGPPERLDRGGEPAGRRLGPVAGRLGGRERGLGEAEIGRLDLVAGLQQSDRRLGLHGLRAQVVPLPQGGEVLLPRPLHRLAGRDQLALRRLQVGRRGGVGGRQRQGLQRAEGVEEVAAERLVALPARPRD